MLCGCYNPNCHNKALRASQCKSSGTELQANVYGRRRDHIIIIQVCAIGVGKGEQRPETVGGMSVCLGSPGGPSSPTELTGPGTEQWGDGQQANKKEDD